MTKSWNDFHKGVNVIADTYGNDVTICYNGLLAKSGADQVYLHYGFGDHWLDTSTQIMRKSNRGWEKIIKMKDNNVNFCFKDSANNWDNNNGNNWSIR
ncbi:MAG: Carbohydrate binding domain (family 25) [Pelotomaculum sp. PtaU1.Bin035]|nr:MAG: Carbohydrate binding domain (family 25) [Pelotomaculum sp. PtaU1.Bin035]